VIILMLTVNVSFAQEKDASEREINKGCIIAGSCLFGTIWLACILTATQDASAGALVIPLVGPFITNAKETPNSSEGLIVAIGISAAEAIGITLVTVGLIGKKKNSKKEIIYPIINKNEYGFGLKIDL
jgi:hypothetical protein